MQNKPLKDTLLMLGSEFNCYNKLCDWAITVTGEIDLGTLSTEQFVDLLKHKKALTNKESSFDKLTETVGVHYGILQEFIENLIFNFECEGLFKNKIKTLLDNLQTGRIETQILLNFFSFFYKLSLHLLLDTHLSVNSKDFLFKKYIWLINVNTIEDYFMGKNTSFPSKILFLSETKLLFASILDKDNSDENAVLLNLTPSFLETDSIEKLQGKSHYIAYLVPVIFCTPTTKTNIFRLTSNSLENDITWYSRYSLEHFIPSLNYYYSPENYDELGVPNLTQLVLDNKDYLEDLYYKIIEEKIKILQTHKLALTNPSNLLTSHTLICEWLRFIAEKGLLTPLYQMVIKQFSITIPNSIFHNNEQYESVLSLYKELGIDYLELIRLAFIFTQYTESWMTQLDLKNKVDLFNLHVLGKTLGLYSKNSVKWIAFSRNLYKLTLVRSTLDFRFILDLDLDTENLIKILNSYFENYIHETLKGVDYENMPHIELTRIIELHELTKNATVSTSTKNLLKLLYNLGSPNLRERLMTEILLKVL